MCRSPSPPSPVRRSNPSRSRTRRTFSYRFRTSPSPRPTSPRRASRSAASATCASASRATAPRASMSTTCPCFRRACSKPNISIWNGWRCCAGRRERCSAATPRPAWSTSSPPGPICRSSRRRPRPNMATINRSSSTAWSMCRSGSPSAFASRAIISTATAIPATCSTTAGSTAATFMRSAARSASSRARTRRSTLSAIISTRRMIARASRSSSATAIRLRSWAARPTGSRTRRPTATRRWPRSSQAASCSASSRTGCSPISG